MSHKRVYPTNISSVPQEEFRALIERVISDLGYVVEVVVETELDGRNLEYDTHRYRLVKPPTYKSQYGDEQ